MHNLPSYWLLAMLRALECLEVGSWELHTKLNLVSVHLFVFPKHSKKRDSGDVSYFFNTKGSLLTIRAMGSRWMVACSLGGQLEFAVSWKDTTINQIPFPNFNLEGKADF